MGIGRFKRPGLSGRRSVSSRYRCSAWFAAPGASRFSGRRSADRARGQKEEAGSFPVFEAFVEQDTPDTPEQIQHELRALETAPTSIDDPVRLYLSEIGQIALLTA